MRRLLPKSLLLASCLVGLASACSSPSVLAHGVGEGGGAQEEPKGGNQTPDGAAPPPKEIAAGENWPDEMTLTVDEGQEAAFVLSPSGVLRFDVDDLPPGALFDTVTGRLSFTPDFTQSGEYTTVVTGHTAGAKKSVRLTIAVKNTIAPPAPTILNETAGAGFKRLVVRQTTDTFLDSPGRAGRWIDAVVVVPTSANANAPAPVVVFLHGFAATPNWNAGSTNTFRIEPHDPDNTYWWGYGDWIPNAKPNQGTVQPYTVRRVLHLVDWLVRTYPQADGDRVFSTGVSMGGAGAMVLGFNHARHFAGIEATIGQAIARNHRPSRITQLTGLYGSPQANTSNVWDDLDITRMLRDSLESREQFVFTKHGKDDPTIHFGAVVTASPLTGKSFYQALEDGRVGHLSVWDEGAHGPADPVLGDGWWDGGWSRITDAKSYLTRRAPFPAFSRSSANDKPIDASPGNGKRPFDAETGYAGKLEVAGDTGWSGAIAGALNRFLRWDVKGIVDTHDKLVLPLYAVTNAGDPAPKAGYPTKRDRYDGPKPIVADVTPRRATAFRPGAGETVRYRFGDASGMVVANADGTVTVPSLAITTTSTTLELERVSPE